MSVEASERDRVMEGIDASRRVAWRKVYELEAEVERLRDEIAEQNDRIDSLWLAAYSFALRLYDHRHQVPRPFVFGAKSTPLDRAYIRMFWRKAVRTRVVGRKPQR